MGHWCRICKRSLPNEKFSGKGHKIHVCKRCKSMPVEKRLAIEQGDEIFGYMKQSRISEKNLFRLKILCESDNAKITELAKIAYETGCIKPHKKRRLKFLAKVNRELLNKLEETGLILAHHW